jgi:hypothetical protein
LAVLDDGPASVWEYEEKKTAMRPTSMLLVRIMIGKIKDGDRLRAIIRNTALRPEVEGWNCVAWVKEAVEAALLDGRALGSSKNMNWNAIRDHAMRYVGEKKAAHRFDGQGWYDDSRAPTWNMLEGMELVS